MGQYSGATYRAGLLFGLVAYVWWGLVPLYFRRDQSRRPGRGDPRPPDRAGRIVLMAGLTAVVGGWARTRAASSRPAGSS